MCIRTVRAEFAGLRTPIHMTMLMYATIPADARLQHTCVSYLQHACGTERIAPHTAHAADGTRHAARETAHGTRHPAHSMRVHCAHAFTQLAARLRQRVGRRCCLLSTKDTDCQPSALEQQDPSSHAGMHLKIQRSPDHMDHKPLASVSFMRAVCARAAATTCAFPIHRCWPAGW